jgi:hypothetical protein
MSNQFATVMMDLVQKRSEVAALGAALLEAQTELTRLRAELSEAEQSSAHNAALYFRAKERADAAIAATEHLRAKVEALRADAERYAYLRNASTGKLVNAVASSAFPCWLNGAELDAAIDAARAALKEAK